MKQIKEITDVFSKYDWFLRVESTAYKKEYIIFADKYPYSDDHIVFEYAKNNKLRLRIHSLR